MADTPETLAEIQKLSPHSCISGFSQTRIWRYLTVAIVIHAIIIPLTSVGYIYHKINPKAAEEAKAKQEAERQAALEAQQAAARKEPDADGAAPDTAGDGGEQQADADKPAATGDAGTGDNQDELLDKHKDTPVVKRITETAKPEEIPKEPDGLGISIEDTAID